MTATRKEYTPRFSQSPASSEKASERVEERGEIARVFIGRGQGQGYDNVCQTLVNNNKSNGLLSS